jgi:renalase
MSVLVVGAGIAGAACMRALRRSGVPSVLVDRGMVPGGRMASRRLSGRYVDLGASYFTVRDDRFRLLVDDWVDRGLALHWTDRFHVASADGLRPGNPGPVRYRAPDGLRSLVADLAKGPELVPQVLVTSVGPGPFADGQAYDAIVLAMPDPQALRLLDPELMAERAVLDGREWEPSIAVAAGWPVRTWDLDGLFVGGDVAAGQVISWVADDGRRRGDGAPVLVAHATPAYAQPRLDDADAAIPGMVGALDALLGTGPPSWTRAQRWRFAKPVGTREEPYWLGPERVGLCGDGWGASKVEAAWLSGTLLGERLAADLS